MAARSTIVICALALSIQSAFSLCAGRLAPMKSCGAAALAKPCGGAGWPASAYTAPALAAPSWGNAPAIEVIPTSGGALPTSSASPIAPNGLSIASENVFEGSLYVVGELPFLSAVALEGVLPSAGAGAVKYSCGNGVTAVTSAGQGATGYGSGAALAPAKATYGPARAAYGLGAAAIAPRAGRLGCSCGRY